MYASTLLGQMGQQDKEEMSECVCVWVVWTCLTRRRQKFTVMSQSTAAALQQQQYSRNT